MNKITTLLADLLSPVNRSVFQKWVDKFKGDFRMRSTSTFDLFKTCVFAHVSGATGMREIIELVKSNRSKLYHNGMSEIPLSTFSDSLNRHNPKIFEKIFYEVVALARSLSAKNNFKFKNPLKIIDASIIEVCLARFNWAKFRKTKGAVKLHAKIDGDSLYPEQVVMTNGNVHEVKTLNHLTRESGVIYVMDRGYIDFKSLYNIELRCSYFVTRMKKGCAHEVIKVLSSSNTDAVRYDAEIKLTGGKTKDLYPQTIRMVKYHDDEHDRDYVFITNNMTLCAQEIADIYKARWQVELFFKWIKQNLKIKSFWGTSVEAVFSQIWIALIVSVLLWIHKYVKAIKCSAHRILQMLKTTILTKNSILTLCDPPEKIPKPPSRPQVILQGWLW